jgi:hypothetical protein
MRVPINLPESILSKQKALERATDRERVPLEQSIIKDKKFLGNLQNGGCFHEFLWGQIACWR